MKYYLEQKAYHSWGKDEQKRNVVRMFNIEQQHWNNQQNSYPRVKDKDFTEVECTGKNILSSIISQVVQSIFTHNWFPHYIPFQKHREHA